GGDDDEGGQAVDGDGVRLPGVGHRPARAQFQGGCAGATAVVEEGRGFAIFGVELGGHRRIGDARVVHAADGVEGVLDVAVGAVVVAAVVDVGQIQQGVAAAVGQLLQAEGQLLPQ